MLSNLVGNVDFNAALVLVALFAAVCVMITSSIVKRRSAMQISNEFELAKMKQNQENARAQYALETDREYKIAQLKENLITSHRVTPKVAGKIPE